MTGLAFSQWRSQPSAAQGHLARGNGANIVAWGERARRHAPQTSTPDHSATHGPVYRAIELLSLSALGTHESQLLPRMLPRQLGEGRVTGRYAGLRRASCVSAQSGPDTLPQLEQHTAPEVLCQPA